MGNAALMRESRPSGDDPLGEFGLSTQLLHDAYRPGLERALSRSSDALKTSAGTDIYHDTVENLGKALKGLDWTMDVVKNQPRFIHPDYLMMFTISTAQNVGHQYSFPQPIVTKKGKVTRCAVELQNDNQWSLFSDDKFQATNILYNHIDKTPFFFLLHERVGQELRLELSRPSRIEPSGTITSWCDRRIIDPLVLNEDFTCFNSPDDFEYNVNVESI